MPQAPMRDDGGENGMRMLDPRCLFPGETGRALIAHWSGPLAARCRR